MDAVAVMLARRGARQPVRRPHQRQWPARGGTSCRPRHEAPFTLLHRPTSCWKPVASPTASPSLPRSSDTSALLSPLPLSVGVVHSLSVTRTLP